MTRKDFILIATALHSAKPYGFDSTKYDAKEYPAWFDTCDAITDTLQANSAIGFKRDLFEYAFTTGNVNARKVPEDFFA